MYQKLVIAHPWLSDRAIVTASSEVGTLPAMNLVRSMYPSDWWRTNDATSATIDIQLPAVEWLQWDLVAPLYTNSGPDGTWQVLAANSQAGLDNPTFEDAVRPLWPVPNMERPGAPEWRHALRWLKGNVRTERWLRLVVNDPSARVPQDAAAPFIQWGRLYVALAWRPSYHHDRGAELIPADERGRRVPTQGGGERVAGGARPRRYSFNVGFLSREEMLTRGYELDRIVGTSRDVLVIEDPEDPVHLDKGMIYGTLPDASGERHEDFDTYSKRYTLREILK